MEMKIELSAEEARRAYFKEWRAKNKDKVKKHNQAYWVKVAAKMAAEAAKNDTND